MEQNLGKKKLKTDGCVFRASFIKTTNFQPSRLLSLWVTHIWPVNTHIKASINGLPWKSRPYRAIPVTTFFPEPKKRCLTWVSTENWERILIVNSRHPSLTSMRGAQNWSVIFRKSAAAVGSRNRESAWLDFVEISSVCWSASGCPLNSFFFYGT